MDFKKFIIKTLKLCLPIVLVIFCLNLILFFARENYYSVNDLIQSDQKYIMGYAYNENNYAHIKWKILKEKEKYDIWSIGSSRVLQFRNRMFNIPFFNAGYTVGGLNDYLLFFKSLPQEKYPKVLILSLDQWMFNENWDNLSLRTNQNYWENNFTYFPKFKTSRNILKDLIHQKYSISSILKNYYSDNQPIKIGLNAIVNSKGMRNDGSLKYGTETELLFQNIDTTSVENLFQHTFSRIDNGIRGFEYGNFINPKAIKELNRFLDFCLENKIEVISYLPPFAVKVREKMNYSKKYIDQDSLFFKLNHLFLKRDFELWDLQKLEDYDSGDLEMIDGIHTSEMIQAKMLVYLTKKGSRIKSYCDVNKLKRAIKTKKNRYEVYFD